MATANTTQKKPCSKCDKGSGIFTCDGCQQSFCRKHSEEHRQELAIQMDSVGQEYDVLQRDIDRKTDTHPLVVRIDAWEQESINKIQQVAKQARDDLTQAINQKKQELKTTISGLTNELQSSREAEDYTEHDLGKWIDQLNKLRRDLDQSINMHLIDEEDQRSTIRLIKVRNLQYLRRFKRSFLTSSQTSHNDQDNMSVRDERFDKGHEQIKLSENGLVATFPRVLLTKYPFIFGSFRYSVGKHCIRFRIEKKTSNDFFIGIVTASQIDPFSISSSTTTNGWWPSYYAVKNGTIHENVSTTDVLEGDEITMTLDCHKKLIYFDYQRSKQNLQLAIDIHKCPFPWKLVVRLNGIGNSIRIIR